MDENKQPKVELPPTLSALLLSLSASALAAMGHEVMPGMEKLEKNLPAAQHVIDTLAMLKQKTEGNRTADESSLLDDLLYQLRMAFVAAQGASPAPPTPPPTGS